MIINEVEFLGRHPRRLVELKNLDETNLVDVSGWGIRDNDTAHAIVPFAAGITIESGGHLVIEEAFLGFGLGSGDSVTLFAAEGTTVVDTDATAPGRGCVLVATRLARRRAVNRA